MRLSLDDIRAARRAPATVKLYRKAWRAFVRWCRSRRLRPLPAAPLTIARYLADVGHRCRATTVRAHLCAICAAHTDAGHPSPWSAPLVVDVFGGLCALDSRRDPSPRRADAVTLDALAALLSVTPPNSLRALRDRAFLALGFAAALRVSELRALRVRDLKWSKDGAVVQLRYTKTGPNQRVAVPFGDNPRTCALRLVRVWLAMSALQDHEHLFCEVRGHEQLHRHRRIGLNRLRAFLAATVKRAQLPPGRYTMHSLRAGLVTTLARAGLPEHAIMRISRHRTYGQVRAYIRDADLFRSHPLTGLY